MKENNDLTVKSRGVSSRVREWLSILILSFVFLFAFLLGFTLGELLFAGFVKENYKENYYPIVCDYTIQNVSDGTVSLKFLIDKVRDYEEVMAFCRDEGFEGGFFNKFDFAITCWKVKNEEEIYRDFPIMKDFALYLYEKYKGDKQ